MTIVNPYLNFDGNCEEAFNFYKSVFGGEFATVMRFKDVPAEYQMSASESEKIMHVALPISKETMLMGSDAPANMEPDLLAKIFIFPSAPPAKPKQSDYSTSSQRAGRSRCPWTRRSGGITLAC